MLNNIPVYIKITRDLERKIINGIIPIRAKLLSVRNLALEYNVNPNTIMKTLNLLEENGYIRTDSTNGKYVTEDRMFLKNMRDKLLNEEVDKFIDGLKKLGYGLADALPIIENKIKKD